ncbi:MAG: ABC transporter permease [Chromatiaceae bacterium]|nr:ABC transporter permease [Chromatiaceae bacterium]
MVQSNPVPDDADRPRSTTELPEVVITPHAGLEGFTEAMRSMTRDFAQSRALAWRLFRRDISAMYRQSLLGYLWLFLPPLATVSVWIFLNQQQLVTIDTGDVPYPLFVMTGTVLWTAFNSALMAMQEIMGQARSMLSKVNFPHEALIMTAFAKALLNGLPPILLLIPVMIFYGVSIGPETLLFAFGFLTVVILGSALGLAFVPIGALYDDVGRAIQLGLRFAFFVTPVIYAMPQAPGLTRTLLTLNPLTAPLVSSRAWLIGSAEALPSATLLVFVVSLLVLALSTLAFKVAMPHLIERISA